MRRPLNWIVVSISLMVLFANRMWAQRPADELASRARQIIPAAVSQGAWADSPFAYVREDGTQEYLPAPDVPAVLAAPRSRFEDVHARDGLDRWVAGDPKAAVYTWSSPVTIAEPQPLSF
jgi:hypothetical protein